MNWTSIIHNEAGHLLLTIGPHSLSVNTQHSIACVFMHFLWMPCFIDVHPWCVGLCFLKQLEYEKASNPSHSSGCDLLTRNPFYHPQLSKLLRPQLSLRDSERQTRCSTVTENKRIIMSAYASVCAFGFPDVGQHNQRKLCFNGAVHHRCNTAFL